MERTLYFAYGSNLNKEQMARRCPTAIPVQALKLPRHRLVFRGVADIIPAKGFTVFGGLWSSTEADLVALDRYEGVRGRDGRGGLYRRVWLDYKGQPCLTYRMNYGSFGEPSAAYLETIREGYANFGLCESSLEAAVEHAMREFTIPNRELSFL